MARGFGKKDQPGVDIGGPPSAGTPTDPEESLRSIESRLDTLTTTVGDLARRVGTDVEPEARQGAASVAPFDPDVQLAARTLVAAERTADDVTATARAEASEILAAARSEREGVLAATRAERDELLAATESERAALVAAATAERESLLDQARADAERLVADRDAASIAERRAWEGHRHSIAVALRTLEARLGESRAAVDELGDVVADTLADPLVSPPVDAPGAEGAGPDAADAGDAAEGGTADPPEIDLRAGVDLSTPAPTTDPTADHPVVAESDAAEPSTTSASPEATVEAGATADPTEAARTSGAADAPVTATPGRRRPRRQLFGNVSPS